MSKRYYWVSVSVQLDIIDIYHSQSFTDFDACYAAMEQDRIETTRCRECDQLDSYKSDDGAWAAAIRNDTGTVYRWEIFTGEENV